MKRIYKATTIVLLTAMSAACGSFYNPNAVAYVDCEGQQCSAMWSRAQTWLATKARYRVQLMSENVIQTYGPLDSVYDGVAYTVTKEDQGNGKSRIYIRGACSTTIYGCVFDPAPYTNLLHTELMALK